MRIATPDQPTSPPATLTALDQWVCWRLVPDRDAPERKPKKLPVDAATGRAASSTDPATWGTHDEAAAFASARGLAGVGFVFSRDDPFAGGDLDGCLDPVTGEVAEWAAELVARLLPVAYVEVSPSRTGLKFIVRGTLTKALSQKERFGPHQGIELYDWGRYFTITGLRVAGCADEPGDGQDILDELVATYSPQAPALPPVPAPPAPADAPAAATGWRAERSRVVGERMDVWVRDCLDWARREMRDAPEGGKHNRRLELGKFLGGVVAAAPGRLSADEALSVLYGAKLPGAHHSQEQRAIRDGLATGMGLPLVPGAVGEKDGRDFLPTDEDLAVRAGRACCPRCDTPVRRSRYDYGPGMAPGWYCPQCTWPMIWPLAAWGGGEVAQVGPASDAVAVPITEGAETARELPLLLPRARLKELPPAVPLIPELLYVNTLHLWFGEPENGKSLLVIGLAATVAQVYRVIYVAAEAVEDYDSRLCAWEDLHGVPADNILFWRRPVRFAVPGEVERFIAEIRPLRPALVVIDPLASCMSGLVESTQDGMQVAIDAMNAIRDATGAAILPIHHTGWDASRTRGSSTLPAAARNMAKIERLEDGQVRLSCAKRNQGPRWPTRLYRMVERAGSVALLPAHMVDAPDARALSERGLKVLRAMTQEGLQRASHNQLTDYTGFSKSGVYELLTQLKKGGYIRREEKGQVKLYELTREGEIAVEEADEDERTGQARRAERGQARAGRFAWEVCPPAVTGLPAVGAIDPSEPPVSGPSRYAAVAGYDADPADEPPAPWGGDGGAEPEPSPAPSVVPGMVARLRARKEAGSGGDRASAD